MRFERRERPSRALSVLAPLGAIMAALLVAGVLIAIAGANPLTAYGLILDGAFGSRLGFSETLTRTTPLILTGLAAAVAFRARVWNIGGEGQFYLGALAVAAIGMVPALAGLPSPLAILVCPAAGAVAGPRCAGCSRPPTSRASAAPRSWTPRTPRSRRCSGSAARARRCGRRPGRCCGCPAPARPCSPRSTCCAPRATPR